LTSFAQLAYWICHEKEKLDRAGSTESTPENESTRRAPVGGVGLLEAEPAPAPRATIIAVTAPMARNRVRRRATRFTITIVNDVTNLA
jgi:hypothetical protein